MTENELVESCLANNRFSQKTLYDRYKKAMYTLAYRITANFDDANDVLQDAFLDVFLGLKNYNFQSTLGAWIRTIVIRKAYKKINNKKIIEIKPDYNENDLPVNYDDYAAEYLEKAILSLPEGYRTVFVMVEIEGFSHKEVATTLDINEGTSKSQLFQAKKRLRQILNLEKNDQ
jgi:RNA polymerase sigma factor (sigma-70 family)